jgi:hypothetical protein
MRSDLSTLRCRTFGKLIYAVARSEILALRSWTGTERVLGAGATGVELRRVTRGKILGWEREADVAAIAQRHFDEVQVLDLESVSLPSVPDVDVVILADVLEHLVDPSRLLSIFSTTLPPAAQLLSIRVVLAN